MRSLYVAMLLQLAASLAYAEERVVLMVGGIDKIIYLPAALAERLGYFREQGLDVEMRTSPAGVEAEDELLAGAVQGVVGFYDHVIDLQAKGKAAVSVVQLGLAPGQVVLALASAAGVRSMSDAAGKRFGVTGLGASTHFLGRYLVSKAGVPPPEVAFMPVGSGDSFMRALGEGSIDLGMTTEPTASRLLASGRASILVDLRTPRDAAEVLGGPYPAACLYMRSAWVREHRSQVRRIVVALLKALQYIATHSAEEITATVPAEFYGADRAVYVKAVEKSLAMFSRDGTMPKEGPQTALAILSVINHRISAARVDLRRTYTSEFLPPHAR